MLERQAATLRMMAWGKQTGPQKSMNPHNAHSLPKIKTESEGLDAGRLGLQGEQHIELRLRNED